MASPETRILEIRETVRLEPIGECIYCGSSSHLSDEHIVPLALGGNLVLPKASCKTCTSITGRTEQKVLRGFMRDARAVANLPTRHPKERPASIKLELLGNDGSYLLDLPLSDACAFLLLPQLEPPFSISGVPPQVGVMHKGVEIIRFGASPAEIAKLHRKTGIRCSANIDVVSFARMVAKIGYGWTVATARLLDRARSPVLPFILGQTDDGSMWLGSASFRTKVEDKNPLHAGALTFRGILLGDSVQRALVAQVKLFANSGATGYEIVTHIEDLCPVGPVNVGTIEAEGDKGSEWT